MRFFGSLLVLAAFVSLSSCDALRGKEIQRRGVAGDICSITDHRAILVGTRLYFMTGNYTKLSNSSKLEFSPQTNLYWINLNRTLPVDVNIPPSYLESVVIPTESRTSGMLASLKNKLAPSFEGYMFRSQDSLFTLDARGSSSIGSYLTEFDTKTSKWQVSALQGNETWDFKGMSGASHANDPSTGLSFLAGGIPLDSTAVPDYRAIQSSTKGLYAFDFSDPSTPKWSNSTNRTTSQYGAAVPTTSQGSMVYLPVGKRGVLLVIGGNNITSATPQNKTTPVVSMYQLSIFDIDTSTWFAINATGAIPDPRAEFCSVVSRAPDSTSFQVTIYGGWSRTPQEPRDDVWVLSIPSFQWIKVLPTGGPMRKPTGTSMGRSNHQCVVWNDRQMVVLGGDIRSTGGLKTCIPDYYPIRVLDTSSFEWRSDFTPDILNYTVPAEVHDVIGGDGSGNATMKIPQVGWKEPKLGEIFASVLPHWHDPLFPLPLDSMKVSPSPAPSNRKTSSKSPLLALLIIPVFILATGVVLWWYRRRQLVLKRNRATLPREDDAAYTKPELDSTTPPHSTDGIKIALNNPYHLAVSISDTPREIPGDEPAAELSASPNRGRYELPASPPPSGAGAPDTTPATISRPPDADTDADADDLYS